MKRIQMKNKVDVLCRVTIDGKLVYKFRTTKYKHFKSMVDDDLQAIIRDQLTQQEG